MSKAKSKKRTQAKRQAQNAGKGKAQAAQKAAEQAVATSNEAENLETAATDVATETTDEAATGAAADAKDEKDLPWWKRDSVWEKTQQGDLIISEDPLKSQEAPTKGDQKKVRRARKKREEKLRRKYGLERMNEYKEPQPISTAVHIWGIALTIAVSALWLFAFKLLSQHAEDMLYVVGMALLLVGSLFAMLITRGFVEADRRYDVKPSTKSVHYYLQMLHYDVRWWFLIMFGIYGAMWLLEHAIPISGYTMDIIYLTCSAYLGYIWTIKYKGREDVPMTYMENIYCAVVMLSNYIVFFLF